MIVISWRSSPNFIFALGVDGEGSESFRWAFRFDVWNDELVVYRESARYAADIQKIQQIKNFSGVTYIFIADWQRCHLLRGEP